MIAYLIKFILCSGFLFSFYKIFLERESMYAINRFYLIVALIFSLLAPLHKVHVPITEEALALSPELLSYLKLITQNSSWWNWQNLLVLLYGSIGILLLVKFISNLFFITLKIKKSEKVATQDVTYVLEDKSIQPYSFLRYIFLEKLNFKFIHPNLIQHEKAHCIQKHSWDIIFIECFQIVFWFNPFVYFYKKAIKLNHEFLADEYVLKNGIDLKSYQHQIVDSIAQQTSLGVTSHFNFILTKKRLVMMSKKTSKRKIGFLTLTSIPFLLSAFVLFGQKTFAKTLAKQSNNLEKIISQPIMPVIPPVVHTIQQTEILNEISTQSTIASTNKEVITTKSNSKMEEMAKEEVVVKNELINITMEQLNEINVDKISTIKIETVNGKKIMIINDSLLLPDYDIAKVKVAVPSNATPLNPQKKVIIGHGRLNLNSPVSQINLSNAIVNNKSEIKQIIIKSKEGSASTIPSSVTENTNSVNQKNSTGSELKMVSKYSMVIPPNELKSKEFRVISRYTESSSLIEGPKSRVTYIIN